MMPQATPTDVPTDEELQQQDARAEQLLDDLLEELDTGEEDPVGVIYVLWISLTHLLAEAGWTPQELAESAAHHAAMQTAEGSA